MSPASNVYVIDLVVRMVVPMKREFHVSLDVQRFMRDAGYATGILAQALNSREPRLCDYADQLRRELTGLAAIERHRGVSAYEQYAKARRLGARVANSHEAAEPVAR